MFNNSMDYHCIWYTFMVYVWFKSTSNDGYTFSATRFKVEKYNMGAPKKKKMYTSVGQCVQPINKFVSS